jgi:hypothetical protein
MISQATDLQDAQDLTSSFFGNSAWVNSWVVVVIRWSSVRFSILVTDLDGGVWNSCAVASVRSRSERLSNASRR